MSDTTRRQFTDAFKSEAVSAHSGIGGRSILDHVLWVDSILREEGY